jgi:hypothetical protein
MELTGGLIILVILAAAGLVGWWAKQHPSETYHDSSESGVSDREWSEAIR